MDFQIDHLTDRHRFQAVVDGLPCVIDYQLADGVMAVTHTGVPSQLEGRGIAGQLMRALLDHARASGLKVAPYCSYASAYMQRHPETRALLA